VPPQTLVPAPGVRGTIPVGTDDPNPGTPDKFPPPPPGKIERCQTTTALPFCARFTPPRRAALPPFWFTVCQTFPIPTHFFRAYPAHPTTLASCLSCLAYRLPHCLHTARLETLHLPFRRFAPGTHTDTHLLWTQRRRHHLRHSPTSTPPTMRDTRVTPRCCDIQP